MKGYRFCWQIFFFCMCYSLGLGLALAQSENDLKKAVDEANPPKKKPENPPPAKKDSTPAKPANGDGKAAFVVDPNLPLDPNAAGKPNTMGDKDKKEDEVKIDENTRVIDTAAFQARMSVKHRDMLRYRKGLEDSAPLDRQNVYRKKHPRDPAKKVIGWHPYWMGEAFESYNFSMLSAVIYFSYELNPESGSYLDIHDWKNTKLIDRAHAADCKVLLSVSSFGERNNDRFLANTEAQNNLAVTLIELLKERKAQGVHLDFEGIPANRREAFTNFVIDLGSKLRTAIKDAWLTVSLPAIDFVGAYDVRQIVPHVNLLIVDGFEFYGANSEVAGPVSLVKGGGAWWNYGLEQSIDEYIAAGAEPAKLLLGVSFYGAEWVTKDLKYPSPARKFVKYSLYRDIKRKVALATPAADAASMSNYYVYRDNNQNYRQIWYDDSLALAQKCDWVASKKIGGIGIWALGYDNGYTQLWEALAAKMTKTTPTKSGMGASFWSRVSGFVGRLFTNPMAVMRNPTVFLVFVLSILGATGGIWYTLSRYSCQFGRVTNLVLRGSLAMLILILVFVFAITYQLTNLTTALWILGGFLIGILVFVLLTRSFLVERELP